MEHVLAEDFTAEEGAYGAPLRLRIVEVEVRNPGQIWPIAGLNSRTDRFEVRPLPW
jgi:hypothetical protein